MKNTYSILLLTALSAALCITSCKKDKNNATPPTPKGLLYLHLHTNIDTTEVDAGDIGRDSSGRRFQLDVAQFYISGITLHKADGSTVTLSNTYVLKNIETEEFYVDSVVAGNYVSVSFNVGIDAAANATNPASYATGNPLAAQDPAMWFGSTTQGYIFMNIQGKADTTAAHNGAVNSPFSYQLGTADMIRTVTLAEHPFSVVANQVALVHLEADYGIALNGVDLKANSVATPWSAAWVATQIANNIPSMFRYEE